jgi:hypothetical protein
MEDILKTLPESRENFMKSAWDLNCEILKSELCDKYKEYLYKLFVEKKQTFSTENAGIFWIILKKEKDAIKIIKNFIRKYKKLIDK